METLDPQGHGWPTHGGISYKGPSVRCMSMYASRPGFRTVRPQEAILDDVRACITTLCNVASLQRMRAIDKTGGGPDIALIDATIADLLRLGVEARGLSREHGAGGRLR